MRLQSVNVGEQRHVGPSLSGIYKQPVAGEVALTVAGLANDAVCDKKHHGGADQAVYVYTADDYAWWDMDLAPGTFGDNLTIEGISSRDVCVGDRFHTSNAVIEATAPRIPCATLGRRMADPKFPIRFRRSERCGFYCRVIDPGMLQAGELVEHEPVRSEDPVTIQELFRLYYEPNPSTATVNRVLATKIAERERRRLTVLKA